MFQFENFFLFVKSGSVNWAIWSSLEAEECFVMSGRAGQACPAHPENKVNQKYGHEDWGFKKEDGKDDWVYGGIHLQCSVHNYQ